MTYFGQPAFRDMTTEELEKIVLEAMSSRMTSKINFAGALSEMTARIMRAPAATNGEH